MHNYYLWWSTWFLNIALFLWLAWKAHKAHKEQEIGYFVWQYDLNKEKAKGTFDMTKNCLTCKYEPEWSEWSGGKYPRCSGACKYVPSIPLLPKVYRCHSVHVERYSDDSGVLYSCPTWGRKIKRRKKKNEKG